MKKNIFIVMLFAFISGSFFLSCDKIDEGEYLTEIPNTITVEPEEITDTLQKFLIEEFTGYRCPNCPAAADEAQKLIRENEGQVLSVALHNGSLATVIEEDEGLAINMVTPEGEAIRAAYSVNSFPQGLINRMTTTVINHRAWAGVIQENKSNSPKVWMTLKGSEFAQETNVVTIKVSAQYKENISDNVNLVLMVTEDSLVGLQYYPLQVKEDNYVHNHVLRQMPYGSWGTVFESPEGLALDESFAIKGTFDLDRQRVSEPKNCSVLAYIMNARTSEIYQVDKIALKDIIK